jgi:hypothetical protein
LAAALSQGVASACVPSHLVVSTVKAATLLVAGQAAGLISDKVAALTEGVLKTMLRTKPKSVLGVLLVLGAVDFFGNKLFRLTGPGSWLKNAGKPRGNLTCTGGFAPRNLNSDNV